jgi:hypothetical protein
VSERVGWLVGWLVGHSVRQSVFITSHGTADYVHLFVPLYKDAAAVDMSLTVG